jgi:LysM repeat protein
VSDTLWDVAKKYSTTVPELMAANSLSAESTPAVLVIPRRTPLGTKHRIL